MIADKKLGGMALLRNLRLMRNAQVLRETIPGARSRRCGWIVSRPIFSSRPRATRRIFEPELETAMLQSLKILSGFPAARGT
jgi:60 kDa SS-A/Ro ribonucleoprotein